MKKLFAITGLLFFAALMQISFWVNTASARELRSSKVVILEPGEGEEKDFYIVKGEAVEVKGDVRGDLYILSSETLITGTVYGDVIAVTGKLILDGRVMEDARLIAGEIEINGRVENNATLISGDIVLNKDAFIGGGTVALTSNLRNKGIIGGQLLLGSKEVSINGTVGKDAEMWTQKLNLNEGSRINGNLTYYSNEDATVSNTSSISGSLLRNSLPEIKADEKQRRMVNVTGKFISFTGSLFIGYLLLRYLAKILESVLVNLKNKPLKSFLIGFISYFAVPVILVLLLITLFGIPASIILLFLYIFILYISRIVLAIYIGRELLKIKKPIWGLIAGLSIIYILSGIGAPGDIFSFAVTTLGSGAIILRFIDFVRNRK